MRTILVTILGMGLLASTMAASAAPKPAKPGVQPAAPNCNKPDADGDGHLAIACGGDDCDDGSANRYPGAAEVCDVAKIDEDCDPTTHGRLDQDGDGFDAAKCCNGSNCGDDCDDTRSGVHRNAPEVCNTRDDNCDGLTDENLTITTWRDADRDLYGSPSASTKTCPHLVPKGNVNNDYDCDDGNIAKNPRAGC
jgi:hypothetical protein